MRRWVGLLAAAWLAGCAGDLPPAPTDSPPPNPFGRPAGASRNLVVGTLAPGEPGASWRLIALAVGHPLRGAEYVVARDATIDPRDLQPAGGPQLRVAGDHVFRAAQGMPHGQGD